jgi:hypothetical protein
MFGEAGVVNQSIPQITRLDETAWRGLLARPEAVKFIVDDAPLIAHVVMEERR